MKNSRIVILGAGHVGSHCASALIARGLCDEIVFIDIDETKARSQALDIADSAVFFPRPAVVRAGDYSDCKSADILVVCVGTPPAFERTRMEYLVETIEMVKTIINPIKESGFSGILINISNPADVITQYIQCQVGYPAEKVISTSTMLDTARLKRILAQRTGIEPRLIRAYSLGEHGASQVIPWSNVILSGQGLLKLMQEQPEKYGGLDLAEITERTIRAGYDVIEGKGSTEFGIGAALSELVKAILYDERKVLPISVLLNGQYGEKEVYASIPAVVGANGVEEILEIPLTKEERKLFADSCAAIRKNYELAMSS